MTTTALVTGLPVAIVWVLRANGIVSTAWASILLAVVLALLASAIGSTLWEHHKSEVVFSELLLWGWLRRMKVEHQIARATASLDHIGPAGSTEEKTRLLKELADALDAQDPYLDGHSKRVARFSTGIAHAMRLPRQEVELIQTAAAIHDVGKLHTPAEILRKPGRLTDEEYAIIKRHADDGAAMVACLEDPALTEVVHRHHCRFDGSGYPDELAGEHIPLGSRIIAVADTFDAITSKRPYRDGKPHKKALDILRTEAGRQLDPVTVDAFLRYYSDRQGSAFVAAITSPDAVAGMRTVVGAAAVSTVAVAGILTGTHLTKQGSTAQAVTQGSVTRPVVDSRQSPHAAARRTARTAARSSATHVAAAPLAAVPVHPVVSTSAMAVHPVVSTNPVRHVTTRSTQLRADIVARHTAITAARPPATPSPTPTVAVPAPKRTPPTAPPSATVAPTPSRPPTKTTKPSAPTTTPSTPNTPTAPTTPSTRTTPGTPTTTPPTPTTPGTQTPSGTPPTTTPPPTGTTGNGTGKGNGNNGNHYGQGSNGGPPGQRQKQAPTQGGGAK